MDYNERAAAVIAPANQVGMVSKGYGAKGEVVVKIWDNFPKNILEGDFAEALWVEIDSIATPLFLTSLARQGSFKVVVTFADFSSERLSSMLVGKGLYACLKNSVEQIADWSFLEGLRFEDLTTGHKGVVVEFVENSMNPLLSVDFDGLGEVLVPIAKPLISKLTKRQLTMHLPSGFFVSLRVASATPTFPF